MTAGSSIVAMRCIRPEQRGQGPRAGTRRARSVPRGGPERRPGGAASLGSCLPHRSRAWSRFETGKSAETSPSRLQRPMATGMHLERSGHGGRAAREGSGPDIAEAILPMVEKER
jgi:hypothetical protein